MFKNLFKSDFAKTLLTSVFLIFMCILIALISNGCGKETDTGDNNAIDVGKGDTKTNDSNVEMSDLYLTTPAETAYEQFSEGKITHEELLKYVEVQKALVKDVNELLADYLAGIYPITPYDEPHTTFRESPIPQGCTIPSDIKWEDLQIVLADSESYGYLIIIPLKNDYNMSIQAGCISYAINGEDIRKIWLWDVEFYNLKDVSEFLFTEPYPDSDTLAQTIFNPAILLYCNFEGLNHLGGDLYSSEYFDSDDYPDYFREQVNGEDRWYIPVNDERYPTYQSFVDELRSYFSAELTQELLSKEWYIERNGKFYMQMLDRGSNVLFQNVTYAITSQTPDKVIFTATVVYVKPEAFDADLPANIPDEMLESKDFVYNYEQIDGKWVFTTFELFY